jgi:hypothetical protein
MATRIDGKKLSLKFGTLEVKAEAGEFTLDNEEADGGYTTFADAANGGTRQWFISITSLTSTDATSFWRFLWDNTGNEVTFTFAPQGVTTVTDADEPIFTGTAVVGAKPPIGGSAGEDWTFEYRLDLVGEPTMDATP